MENELEKRRRELAAWVMQEITALEEEDKTDDAAIQRIKARKDARQEKYHALRTQPDTVGIGFVLVPPGTNWRNTTDMERQAHVLYRFRHLRVVRWYLGGYWEFHRDTWYAALTRSGWCEDWLFSPTFAPQIHFAEEIYATWPTATRTFNYTRRAF